MTKDSYELAAMELLEEALNQPSDQRETFIQESDAPETTKERALELLWVNKSAPSLVRTGAAKDIDADEPVPERIGSYRILRLLERGGMGAVYLGERAEGDFDHVAAIKLIKAGLLSESVIERFRRERQILANLSHNNIARLFDGGQTDNGSPYIVMEFVEGSALSHWIRDTKPTLDERLKLFREICDAVGFAHQNLIIHRDLTPSNILVTPLNEAKLIDFGIAKPHEEENDNPENSLGAFSLTPGFAAPERSSGASANTLTDIYSLGKILQLLVDNSDRPELDAIAQKAAHNDPNMRYKTAENLANDVKRYQDGFPIGAYASGGWYRISKFVRRQKLAVGATAAFAIVLIGGLVTTSWAYNQAEQARAEAELRFGEVRTIAKTLMFDVFDEVSQVPGSTNARILLAETSQEYLDSLAETKAGNPDILLDAAMGYFRLARVTGSSTGATLGKVREGRALYDKARSLLQELHNQHPERQDIAGSLGRVVSIVAGEKLYVDGDPKGARKDAELARKLLSDLDKLDEDTARALGVAYHFQGESYAWENDAENASKAYTEGIQHLSGLSPSLAKSGKVQRSLAGLNAMQGQALNVMGRNDDAIEALQKATQLRRIAAEGSSNAPDDIRNLTIALYFLGQTQLQAGKLSQANKSSSEALALSEQSMAKSPNDYGPRELFTGMAMLKGQILAKQKNYTAAISLARKAIAANRRLLVQADNSLAGKMGMAARLKEASEIHFAAKNEIEACRSVREALSLYAEYEETKKLPEADRKSYQEPLQKSMKRCTGS